MESNDLWFVTRWLDQMALGDSDKNNNKRKRSVAEETMASDSGYSGDAVGELLSSFIPTTKTSKKEKLHDEIKI